MSGRGRVIPQGVIVMRAPRGQEGLITRRGTMGRQCHKRASLITCSQGLPQLDKRDEGGTYVGRGSGKGEGKQKDEEEARLTGWAAVIRM